MKIGYFSMNQLIHTKCITKIFQPTAIRYDPAMFGLLCYDKKKVAIRCVWIGQAYRGFQITMSVVLTVRLNVPMHCVGCAPRSSQQNQVNTYWAGIGDVSKVDFEAQPTHFHVHFKRRDIYYLNLWFENQP